MRLPAHLLATSIVLTVSVHAEALSLSEIANPFAELTPKIEWSMLTPESIQALGVDKKAYYEPNELVPIRMLNVTSRAPVGGYIGVGTDRCLMAAAINPQIEWLIMADYDPRVVRFNQINLALIRASKNKEHYQQLRLKGTHEDWKGLVDLETMPPQDIELLSSTEAHAWWHQNIQLHDGGNMRSFQTNPPYEFGFLNANFIHYDDLFERVSALARGGKIQVAWINFAKPADLEKLVQTLKSRSLTISILDISNAWFPSYLGYDRLKVIVEHLRAIATEGTLLLGTATAEIQKVWLDSRPVVMGRYTYFSARFSSLVESVHWKRFVGTLARWYPKTRTQDTHAKEVERVDPHLCLDNFRG